ncbi:KamA family radical SAM protein [Pseudomonas gingeri]|uniref:Lysine 2,3-aminomutase n=1 Tax=Pseudomonas gingeri TaxID=117681 RepID=A0A7Y8CLH9_9PSED|nr:lysine 2,3-aminomutase [Pseudomonas gingeri]NWB30546.1 lysine 2,3-aminomutase [Pseudomonas gingeri]NWC35598.1 lysine 2,3-aminomutase [Pseudomonas gingeri]
MQGMSEPQKYKPYNSRTIRDTVYWQKLTQELQEAMTVVSKVMPFRTNDYVLSTLIDWNNIPDDPIFRMTFPHRDMLHAHEYEALKALIDGDDSAAVKRQVEEVWQRMNPHPAGQLTHNTVTLDGKPLSGIQHKYRETVLFFPGAGQTCHAYCTFCFRWAQFIGEEELKFNARESQELAAYLRVHTEVTDVLITGGDPLIMNTRSLAEYIEPLLAPDMAHIKSIRLGTKSVAYWPQRFVTDKDADALIDLFKRVVATGKNLSVMGHYNHPVEIKQDMARQAIQRIRSSGATLRIQAPLIRHINEDPADWAALWTEGVRLGAIPYYFFVERDTGPSHYFAMPLHRAFEIYQSAYRTVSGLARTVRGPSMSTFYGKVVINGIETVGGEKVFVLQFLQARDPQWVLRTFYAKFDPQATWFDELVPAFGEEFFFFQNESVAPPKLIPVVLEAV